VISKEHRKHTQLTRPASGNFGRNEWAIVGGQCQLIKALAGDIIEELSPIYKCAYADTSHNDDNEELPGRLKRGGVLEYTDEISYQQLNYRNAFTPFKLREIFAGADLVLVNGNHQQAKAQVVIICESKRASLAKRVLQLNNVQMFLLAEGADAVFDFVKDVVPYWQNIPIYKIDETEKIIAFFNEKMQAQKPVLNGLVLAGGKSQRMGFDKSSIDWHGKEQRYFMADLLKPFCKDVFISCRADQVTEMDDNYSSLPDTFIGLGPYGAILSAFREKPDSAWLVVACDLPLVNEDTLQHLIANRDTSAIATTYRSDFDGFPEPLITIWEPKSYPVLLNFLSQGHSCPRKVLINNDVCLLQPPNPEDLTNVNTPEEFEQIKNLLHQKI